MSARRFWPGEGPFNRKAWIENRLEELAQIFAVTVGGFSVMDNHLHLLLRLDPDVARVGRTRTSSGAGAGFFPLATNPAAYCRCPIIGFKIGSDLAWVANRSRAVAKPQLVHEVSEGTAGSAGQSPGKTRGAFLRNGSRASRSSMRSPPGRFCLHRFESGRRRNRVRARNQQAYFDQAASGPCRGSRPDRSTWKRLGGQCGGFASGGGLEDSLWLCPIEDRRERTRRVKA